MTDIEVVACQAKHGIEFKLAISINDRDPVTENIRSGNYTLPFSIEMLLAGIEPKSTVLDLGAHIGTFSLAAAALGYEVIAIDGSPHNVELLRESAKLNDFENLRVVHSAISDRVGTVSFFEWGPYGGVSTVRFAPWWSSEVPVTTVDELVFNSGIEGKIKFIKMDIEGSEVAAVRGMGKLLSAADGPAIFYESNGHCLYKYDETPQTLISEIGKYGYESFLVEIPFLFPIMHDYVQYACTVDYFAVKHISGRWRDCLVDNRMNTEDQVMRALAACESALWVERLYVARALEKAPASILMDERIQHALTRLKSDDQPEVVEAIKWHSAASKGDTQPVHSPDTISLSKR